jgi:PAS domain S-box-containing protein
MIGGNMEHYPPPQKAVEVDGRRMRVRLPALELEQARPREESIVSPRERDRYRDLIEKAHDIIYWTDANGNIINSNTAAERSIGYSKEELLGRHYLELIHPDYRDEATEFYGTQFVSMVSDTYFELPLIARDGREIWVGQQVQLIMSGDTLEGFRAIARDITKQKDISQGWKKYQDQLETMVEARTFELKKNNKMMEAEIFERKQVESALLESEVRYRSILETIEEGYYEVDLEGNMTFFNDALTRILGYSKNELMNMNNRQYTDEENAEYLHQIYTGIYYSGKPSKGSEFEIIQPNGERKVVEASISLIKNSSGAPTGYKGIIRDITDLRQAQVSLQKTNAKITTLINSISSILIAVSDSDEIIFWNTEAEKQFGISEKEVLGKSLSELGITWKWADIRNGFYQCRQDNIPVELDDLTFTQNNGKEGILVLRLTPLLGKEYTGTGILIQGANITKRKIMESQLTQAQKLESIGQLAAGIAHEINTPTQYVGDNVHFLETSYKDLFKVLRQYEILKEGIKEGKTCDRLLDQVEEIIQEADLDYLIQEIPQAIHQALDGVERVSRIVQSMKAFAHPGKEEKIGVDINQAIENTIMVARNEWKYVADLIMDLDPSLPLTPCIPGDINQVLLNVLVNAAQAVSEVIEDGSAGKGKISISTKQDGSWVEIRISDTGKGIPEEIRSKIFDPFFTTKKVGKGTGQGLAIAYTAVAERHDGSITFETETGRGTTFKIKLPIEEAVDAGD